MIGPEAATPTPAPAPARSKHHRALLRPGVRTAAVEPSTPTRAPVRDRYLDLLRAVALFRVVAYHSFASAAWLSMVFPSMGVMFALAGSLMARSLERPALGVLKSRTRRLLLPLGLYSATVLVLLLWEGWTPDDDGGSWLQLVLWFVPVGDPPFPQAVGTDAGLVESSWASQAEEILWYIRAYFWFMLLSPLLLTSFRRFPWPTLLAPLALMAVIGVAAVPLPEWGASGITDFATYGSCWLLGFAHYQGLLRKIPRWAFFTAGPALMALGLHWAFTHPDGSDMDLNNIPLAQALWSLGFSAMLFRISPSWQSLPGPLRFLDKTVTLMNNRAMTIYLWHNLLLVITVVIIDRLYDIEAVAAAIPWLLDAEWTQFIGVWLLMAVLFLTIGWVEDVAAKRHPQLWPTGSRKPAREKRGPAAAGGSPDRPARIPSVGSESGRTVAEPLVTGVPIRRGKLTALPLSRQAGPVRAFRCTIEAGSDDDPQEPLAHEGEESIHVLNGRLRLSLGGTEQILAAGESADFDPRVPHSFGRAGTEAVDFLGFFGRHSELVHLSGGQAVQADGLSRRP